MKKKSAVGRKKDLGKFNGKVYSEDENLILAEEKLNKLLDKVENYTEDKELKKKCAAVSSCN